MFAALDDEESEDAEEEEVSLEVVDASRKERRLEEFEALEAIYGQEACWKESGEDDDELETISLRIGPRQWTASATPPMVVVKARRSERYPDLAALGPVDVVTSSSSSRVPGKFLAALRIRLTERASELVGDVAMHDLAEIVSESLESLELSALPLNERMAARERREAEEDVARNETEQRTRAAVDDEGARRVAKALDAETRRGGALVLNDDNDDDDDDVLDDDDATARTRAASRYESDFKELSIIGSGGCGQVAKCVNRLDKRVYAIKKVGLGNGGGSARRQARRQLREVEALATVFHPHVVRYYQAWVEGDLDDGGDSWSVDDEDDSSSSSSSSSSSDISSESSSDWRGRDGAACVLYIQMEFCPRTLRELVDSKALVGRPDDAWRLVRQMIEALAYLHETCSIVHRDLKPANVFVDALANVKVGDLGLATTISGDDEDEEPDDGERRTTSRDERGNPRNIEEAETSDTLTRGVGTALYRAPEVAAERRSHERRAAYDRSADMYSLGVVVYEVMHPPFGTGMERIERLQGLRHGRPIFDDGVDACARALVTRLVREDPSERPTAMALLEGEEVGLLPSSADAIDGDASLLSRAKATVRNPFSRARAALVDALFDSETTAVSDFSYGRPSSSKSAPPPRRRLRSASSSSASTLIPKSLVEGASKLRAICEVESALRDVFERHGAINVPSPVVRPRARRGDSDESITEGKKDYELVDPAGVVVVLPSELTTPFARRVASEPTSQRGIVRRYEIGRVFEKRSSGSGPRERRAAAFDAVCFGSPKNAATVAITHTIEAECLALAAGLIPGCTVIVGHADFSPAVEILGHDSDFAKRHARLAANGKADPLECLDALAAALQKVRRGDEGRDRARRKLKSAVEKLSQLLRIARDFAGMRWRGGEDISTLPTTIGSGPLARTVFSVAARVAKDETEGQLPRVIVDVAGAHNKCRKFTPFGDSGAFFWVVPCSEDEDRRSPDEERVLCVGGSYDSAIARHVAPVDRPNVDLRAVGIRIDTERLVEATTLGDSFTSQRPGEKRSLVLCCSLERTDDGDCASLLAAATLRSNGIDAAHMPRHSNNGKKQDRKKGGGDEALSAGARAADWLVMLSQESAERCTVLDVAAGYSAASPRRQIQLESLFAATSMRTLFDDDRNEPFRRHKLLLRLVRCGEGGKRKKATDVERRVLASIRHVAGDVTLDERAQVRCFVVDAPLHLVRHVATAFVSGDRSTARNAASSSGNKRELLHFADALADALAAPADGRLGGPHHHQHFAYAYALPDNALDLVFLPGGGGGGWDHHHASKKGPSQPSSAADGSLAAASMTTSAMLEGANDASADAIPSSARKNKGKRRTQTR